MGTDIPLWIGGLQKWVTGVTRHTTCEEVVAAVIAADRKSASASTTNGHHQKRFAIVERWHKVERPLDPRAKLLKVWNTWGVEQCNVRFLLKRAHHAATTPREVKAHRRKSGRSTKTCHPRKLRSESEDDGRGCCEGDYEGDYEGAPFTEEQLRNLISHQGEAIAAQLRRLQEKDDEIERIENEIHTQRVNQIGANYVVDTYLAESSDSSTNENPPTATTTLPPVTTTSPPVNTTASPPPVTTTASPPPVTTTTSPPPVTISATTPPFPSATCDTLLDHCIELYEKVLDVCDQVHREEDNIRELTAKLKRSVRLNESDDGDLDPEIPYAGPERINEILRRTKTDIERLLRISQTQQMTIQQNEQTLSDCAQIIEDKHRYLERLKLDLDRLDQENARLQEDLQALQVIAMDSGRGTVCEGAENGDSNSDTGLSSLHSSDDGVNVLDTLV